MRQELRRYRSAILLILAFSLGLGAQLLQAQVSVTPGRYRFGATIAPSANDGAALGTAALSWSDLFLASGAVINAGNGEVTLTFAADSATLAGGQFLIPDGSAALPAIAFSGNPDTGFRRSSSALLFVSDAADSIYLGSSVELTSTGRYGWADGTDPSAAYDTELARDAAATVQMGADAASPVAQRLKGADARAGTDTDTAGGNMTLAPGRGTGTGASGKLIFAFSNPGAAGTTANPLMNIASFSASGGHFLLPELAVDPSSANMTADAEIAVYSKNDRLVFAYNNGGIMTFLSIALDGSATTWTHSTTAP